MITLEGAMDPYGYKFDDEGNILLLSDPNDWDLYGGHYRNLGISDPPPFHLSDVGPLGFSPQTNSIFNPEPEPEPEPLLPPSDADPSSLEEDTDFSDTFKFIRQILMEENFEHKPCMCYDPLSLQHTEKSFYDALKEKQPLSPNQHPLDILESPDSGKTANTNELKLPSPDSPVSALNSVSHDTSQLVLPLHDSNGVSNGVLDFDLDSSVSKLLAQNIFSNEDSMLQFKRGLEEASKFLPQRPQLFTGLEGNLVTPEKNKEGNSRGVVKSRKNHEREGSDDEEGRSNKQSAGNVDEGEISEIFDKVLLSVENVPLSAEEQNGSITQQSEGTLTNSSDGAKIRSKKQGKKKETVDLRTLLVLCAQAVSATDNRTANELLKQIRQHSNPLGDASQRLAHYFANGIEARLVGAGTGTQIFYMTYKKFTAAHYLRAYQLFISACPFKKFAHFFANKMIMKTAAKAETLHIIDFGILYGFQWPILIKILSQRSGGPPKLRITGIEYPQAGFRPAERIEETGRRLANYCKRFNVPFDYKAIASRDWETIQIEDLKIKRNEVLAVNCLVRFKNLLDETIEVDSPRNACLNLIRRINPDIFVQSIMNGSYNAPFFVSRFREALFHYSAMYDMFDTLMPHENEFRLLLEREFLGREIMNVVACEGLERVERPETYKQWQVRNIRAGFRQLPLDKEIMAKFRDKLREWYSHHKDFVFDEDNNWMLQGWKGRILFASACWVPA